MSRIVVVGVIVCGLLAGALWVLLPSQKASPGRPISPDARFESDDVALVGARPEDESTGIVSEKVGDGATTKQLGRVQVQRHEPTPRFKPRPGERSIRGTISVVDDQGKEHRAESGTMDLVVWEGTRGEHRSVPIEGGRWESSVPAGARVGFQDLRLRDRTAVLEDRNSEPLTVGDGPLQVRAQWVEPVLVHVRSAATGEELVNLEVTPAPNTGFAGAKHPGYAVHEGRLQRFPASPVELTPAPRNNTIASYFVRSPGFAWGLIRIDPQAGGDRVLELQAGGDLVIEIDGAERDPGFRLRVRPSSTASGAPMIEVPIGNHTELTLAALPLGRYDVSVELGRWYDEPRVLAKVTEASVRVDLPSLVTLQLEELEALDQVELEGQIVLPTGWDGIDRLEVRLLDPPQRGTLPFQSVSGSEMAEDDNSAGGLDWNLGPVQAGRYQFTLHPQSYTEIRTVTDGDSFVRLEVPPPGRVEVTTVLAGTGQPADLDGIHWQGTMPRGASGGGLIHVLREEGASFFEFYAPLGTIHISVLGSQYNVSSKSVTVVPGTTQVTFELEVASGVLIFLLDGDTPVPWTFGDARAELTAVGHSGRMAGWGGTVEGQSIRVTQPGRYRLTVPALNGYQPVPEREVDILDGEILEIDIQLDRLP